jgi:putative ABC transport system permease protein
MSLSLLLRVAWEALRRNATRSLLTMLGIIIGVGAVITSMAIGSGAQAAVLAQIESLGANLAIVIPGAISTGGVSLGNGTKVSLSLSDVTAISQLVPEIAAVAPLSSTSLQVVAGGMNWLTTIEGSTLAYQAVRNWPVAQGRFFTQAEVNQVAKVAVLGNTVAQNLFPAGGAVGATVIIKNVPFRVLGVMVAKGQSGFGRDQDDFVMVPITTLIERLTGITFNWSVGSIMISATSPEAVPEVIDETERLLRYRHHLTPSQPDDFQIRNISDVQQVRIATSQTQALLLAAIAVVSLVVGGIGIMNIMLVSVTERTREIGLRMAVGARGNDILLQFLVEALTLACIGGVIGIIMGVAISEGASMMAHWPTLISPMSIVMGFVSAMLVGVIFGFYPAQRAAALDPIVALRYE